MSKTVDVSVRVHKDVPACCRASLLKFAAVDRYQGAGEPGDRVECPCGQALVYGPPGWRVSEQEPDGVPLGSVRADGNDNG